MGSGAKTCNWSAVIPQEEISSVSSENVPYNTPSQNGMEQVARAMRNPETIVREVMKATSFSDADFVHQVLEECNFDVHKAIMMIRSTSSDYESNGKYFSASSRDGMSSNASNSSTDSRKNTTKQVS